MANKEKVVAPLSPISIQALAKIKENPDGLTMAELKVLGIDGINSANLVALKTRGLVVATEVEIEVPTITKRTVLRYRAVERND